MKHEKEVYYVCWALNEQHVSHSVQKGFPVIKKNHKLKDLNDITYNLTCILIWTQQTTLCVLLVFLRNLTWTLALYYVFWAMNEQPVCNSVWMDFSYIKKITNDRNGIKTRDHQNQKWSHMHLIQSFSRDLNNVSNCSQIYQYELNNWFICVHLSKAI